MSLVRLGQKPPTGGGPADLLLDCHKRIRSFSELAVRLAIEEAPELELVDAAARVHRYFTEALPLHVADEEQSLAPRLRRFAADTAEALLAMEHEHRAHEVLLARLLPAWHALQSDPQRRGETRDDAVRLRAELEGHLAAEERMVIPALVRLPVDEQRSFEDEVRARRSR